MSRNARRLLLGAGAGLLLFGPGLRAQAPGRVRRIGFLALDAEKSQTGSTVRREFVAALRRAGYEEGKSLVFDWRWADGNAARLLPLAEDLVRQKVDLIVAFTNLPVAAAMRASATTPVVMFYGNLPVENGLVKSLPRPGGNVTGTTYMPPETAGKVIGLVKEAAPGTKHVALLWNPAQPGFDLYRAQAARHATDIGMSLRPFEVARPDDVAAALKDIAASQSDALYVFADGVIRSRIREIIEFALKRKLVSIGSVSSFAIAGGLLYYGPQFSSALERTAGYVDQILRGAKPADLPVEEPRKYELIVNLKTAGAIGLRIPAALLQRADRLIE